MATTGRELHAGGVPLWPVHVLWRLLIQITLLVPGNHRSVGPHGLADVQSNQRVLHLPGPCDSLSHAAGRAPAVPHRRLLQPQPGELRTPVQGQRGLPGRVERERLQHREYCLRVREERHDGLQRPVWLSHPW